MQKLSIFICTKCSIEEHLNMLKTSCLYLFKVYPNVPIYIINDNSDIPIVRSSFINNNITIIDNEFIGSGELSRLYYYYKLKPSEYALCIHDNQFINKAIDYPDNYEFLFTAQHNFDDIRSELRLINNFKDRELTDFYFKKNEWGVGFGIQCIVKYSFLQEVANRYPYFFGDFIKSVRTRVDRCACERVVPCVFNSVIKNNKYIYGDIHKYTQKSSNNKVNWGVTFSDIKNNINTWFNKPTIKCWSGR